MKRTTATTLVTLLIALTPTVALAQELEHAPGTYNSPEEERAALQQIKEDNEATRQFIEKLQEGWHNEVMDDLNKTIKETKEFNNRITEERPTQPQQEQQRTSSYLQDLINRQGAHRL